MNAIEIRRFFVTGALLLLLYVNGYAQSAPPAAGEVLKEASAAAAKEKKNVFIIFHASWCGWCHRMDTLMNDPACKAFFSNNYVVRHLTVFESAANKALENPGALDLLKKYKADNQGIPFWLVFDPQGNLLADSQSKPGENTGCPATEEEVAHFINVLRKTSPLKEEELQVVANVFLKKK